jgi:transposase
VPIASRIRLRCHASVSRGSLPSSFGPRRKSHIHFHFTPVGSSWLNQIETWFGIITRQSIRRGTVSSVKVLIKQIRDYITHWNSSAKPFVWTATANEILAKVRLVEANIKKLVDNNAK